MSETGGLMEWLTACVDEDEARIGDYAFVLGAVFYDPQKLRREVAFRRKLLTLAAEADDIHYDRCTEVGADLPGVLIGERIRQALAEVYEDRPGYGQFAEVIAEAAR